MVVAGTGKLDGIPTPTNDSKQLDQGTNANFNWLQAHSDVSQMRQALEEEKAVRNIRKQELRQKETVLINSLWNAFCQEQQARTGTEEELHRVRNAYSELEERLENELLDVFRTLDDEIALSNMRELELKEKETIIQNLHKTLVEEHTARIRLGEEIKDKEKIIHDLREMFKEENEARTRLEAELSDKETIAHNLQKTLREENEERVRLEAEFRIMETTVIDLQKTSKEENEARRRLEGELTDKKTIVHDLQKTLIQESEERIRIEAQFRDMQTTLLDLQKTSREEHEARRRLEDEFSLERSNNVIIVSRLQETLREEQQEKARMLRGLNQARNMCLELEDLLRNERLVSQSRHEDIQAKENDLREQGRLFEEECRQKAALEETVRGFQLRMEEERNRHALTERELESALSAVQDAFSEYQRHQPRDWIIQREEAVLSERLLGRGGWGNVREGTFRSCRVAVKEIHELILSDHNRRLFEREMNIASCCRHPNLLQFIGATNDDGSPLFVTELLDTSLRHLLSQRALNQDEIVRLALDVAKGLNYLHLNKPLPIIHRDISSANVLLWRRDEQWKAKLSDYGSANFLRQVMTVNAGAVIYSAPEASTSKQSSKVIKK